MRNIVLIFSILTFQSCMGKKDSAPPPPQTTSVKQYELNLNDGIIGSTSTSSLARWNNIPAADHYEISIGTEKGKTDIKDWLNIGQLNETTLNIPSNIVNNTRLYTNVRAFDQNNDIIGSSSGDGWTVVNSIIKSSSVVRLNEEVNAIDIDESGNKYLGGYFDSINPIATNGILPLSSTGTISSSYSFGTTTGGILKKMPNNKYLFYNQEKFYNGLAVKSLIMLNSNGTIDSSFSLDTFFNSNSYYEYYIFPNNEILIKYYSYGVGYKIAKLLTTGSLDSTFTSNFSSAYTSSPTVSIVSNQFYISDGTLVKRYNNDGSFDSSFTPLNLYFSRLNQMSDGNIITTDYSYLKLFNSGMIEDTAFSQNTITSGICYPTHVLPTSTNKYIVAYQNCSTHKIKISLINRDGTLDSTFNSNFGDGFSYDAYINAMAIDSSNRIYLSAYTASYNNIAVSKYLFRINSNGAYDSTFISSKAGFNAPVQSIIVDGTNVITTGNFKAFGGTYTSNLIKLNSQDVVTPFEHPVTVNGTIQDLKVHKNKIYIVGDFTRVNGQTRNKIAKLNLDGTLSNDFSYSGFNTDALVQKVAFFKDDKLLVSGFFKKYNQTNINGLVKILPDGSRDSSFSSGLDSGISPADFSLQSDGKILIILNYNNTYREQTVKTVFRLNPNGSLDNDYNNALGTNFNNFISNAITLSDDSSIFCGYHTLINGQNSLAITKIKKSGEIDSDFRFPTEVFDNGNCQKISLTPNGQIIATGDFQSTILSTTMIAISLLPDGSVDRNFSENISNTGLSAPVIKQASNGRVYLGGGIYDSNGIHYFDILEW